VSSLSAQSGLCRRLVAWYGVPIMTSVAVESNCTFSLVARAAALILVSMTGCQDKPAPICKAACDGEVYGCITGWGREIAKCHDDIADAHNWCRDKGGAVYSAYLLDCQGYADDETGGGGDPSWTPRYYVDKLAAGVYSVDHALT